jgi:hypothetical protein
VHVGTEGKAGIVNAHPNGCKQKQFVRHDEARERKREKGGWVWVSRGEKGRGARDFTIHMGATPIVTYEREGGGVRGLGGVHCTYADRGRRPALPPRFQGRAR